jgi:uncharacterized membrane protein YgdD (TMEM256/DUF423 family)
MNARTTIITAAIFCFLGVLIGAFAAHGLKLEGYAKDVFETGVRYHFYHAFALLIVGTIGLIKPNWIHRKISILFTLGIIVFSGSLYILAITGIRWLGAITPFGGLSFMAAWIFLVVGILKSKE